MGGIGREDDPVRRSQLEMECGPLDFQRVCLGRNLVNWLGRSNTWRGIEIGGARFVVSANSRTQHRASSSVLEHLVQPFAGLLTRGAFTVHPQVGVRVQVGAFRDAEDFGGRDIQKGESCQIEMVVEIFIADMTGVLAADQHRPALQPCQTFES